MPLPGLTLQAGYTLTDARNLNENVPLEGQSVHRWFAQARFSWRPWGLTMMVRGSVTGPRSFTSDTGTRWTRIFGMLDARIAKAIGPVELFIAGANLLGAGNATDLPLTPRSVFLGISVHD
jgi:outer membrane receptor for ferrienterochelin and colicins